MAEWFVSSQPYLQAQLWKWCKVITDGSLKSEHSKERQDFWMQHAREKETKRSEMDILSSFCASRHLSSPEPWWGHQSLRLNRMKIQRGCNSKRSFWQMHRAGETNTDFMVWGKSWGKSPDFHLRLWKTPTLGVRAKSPDSKHLTLWLNQEDLPQF